MPELPEVETVRRVLLDKLVGLIIEDIDVRYENIIECDVSYFINSLKGKRFSDVKRLGKTLIFQLEDVFLTTHLRMEGKFFILPTNHEISKHEHVIFHLSNKMDLRYHDVRKFGRMTIKHENDLYSTPPLSVIGYEPLDDRLTPDWLLGRLNKRLPIKSLLLDQSIMSGLGNIYVDEVLFASKINPMMQGKDLTLSQANSIIKNSQQILSLAIQKGGTTIRSYTSSLGVKGNYQDFLKVHTLVGKKCVCCGEIIVKTKIGGRGTYYCPKCQPEVLTK